MIREFLTNKKAYLLAILLPFLAMGLHETPCEISKEALADDEKVIYNELGPLYQKIYLYVFDAEQRHRTVVFVKRGLDPYEAINTVLRPEMRAYEARRPKHFLTPAERAELGSSPHIDYK